MRHRYQPISAILNLNVDGLEIEPSTPYQVERNKPNQGTEEARHHSQSPTASHREHPGLLLPRAREDDIPQPLPAKQELVRVPAAVAVGVDLPLGNGWRPLVRRRRRLRDEGRGVGVLARPGSKGRGGRAGRRGGGEVCGGLFRGGFSQHQHF